LGKVLRRLWTCRTRGKVRGVTALEEVLDFAALLAPIPGENPAGEDLREDFGPDSVYRRIRAARSEARDAERRLVFDDDEGAGGGEPANWQPILDLAPKAIAERSKDLELAAVLIEALVRKHGYPGLRDGYRLTRELVERFWDQLYPQPDEDDGVFARVAPLSGLNGHEGEGLLLRPIAKVPITAATSVGEFSVSDYRMAGELDAEPDAEKRARRLQQSGAVTLEMFQKAVSETPAEFFDHLVEDVRACSDEFEKLCVVLDEKCGVDESGFSQAPPSSNIRAALEETREIVNRITGRSGPQPASGEGQGSESAAAGAAVVGDVSGSVESREEAFRSLLRVAAFFKRTEPHSPVSYALEQAVQWGRMQLPELLEELIADENVRAGVFKRLGIRPPGTQ
jgi:type VI secretion system protein ImpA